MLMRFTILAIVAAVAGATILSVGTLAQSTNSGVLNAVRYQPLPAGTSLKVRALDNSDENLATVEKIAQSLRLNGYGVEDSAIYVLTIETEGEAGVFSSSDDRHLVELSRNDGTTQSEETRLRLNLYDSAQGGVLNEDASPRAPSIVKRGEFTLLARIENRLNGRQHWEAWLTADQPGIGRSRLVDSMIPPLVGAIDRSVQAESFPIQ